jgi:hypothetical protein
VLPGNEEAHEYEPNNEECNDVWANVFIKSQFEFDSTRTWSSPFMRRNFTLAKGKDDKY